ncbi:MAG: DHHA1 domain-containing protein [Anaerolineae bacterium]|nr:DHHA1 domain-containing protein [Thermoflexales bacterium]MDW8408074.1 DHHA1 domain-containing protein [Anaerolineae bacterium]
MTLRLYRANPYLRCFSAQVVEHGHYQGRPAVVLDQTAFYPTSGGQAHDVGYINGVAVIDVIEREDNTILHVLDQAFDVCAGAVVTGQIDWPRRFDLMQQHSGQHVLSAAFVRVAGLDTLSVHMGNEASTLDLPTPRLERAVIERAEDAANQAIYDNLPITAREVTRAEVEHVPVRKPPTVDGLVRIVEIQGLDWSACGGTHVSSTGQIGIIRIVKTEKRGNETRVYFVCGRRAVLDYREASGILAALGETFRVGRHELPAAIERLRAEAQSVRKALSTLQERLIDTEALALLRAAENNRTGGGHLVIAHTFAERDAAELKAMAKRLVAEPGVIVLLGAAGEKASLCFARAKDAPGHMGEALRSALATLGAKGGGSAEFAQGGGLPANIEQVKAAIELAKLNIIP